MRRVLVEVSGEYILRWLTTDGLICPGETRVVAGLPPGARLVGAQYEMQGSVLLAFEHELFADIPEGNILPRLDIVMEAHFPGRVP